MGKTLVIGDVHGCYNELIDLLEAAGWSANDSIVALGDLIDRGPDSTKVIDFFRNRSNAISLMGNHERKHIQASQGITNYSVSQLKVKRQFSYESYKEFILFIRSFPLCLKLPDAALVHGCYEPGISLEKQQENILTGAMSGERYLSTRFRSPWYELYDGELPLIAGHHDYSTKGEPLVYKDRVYLIDTGCCYGKNLTGLILPDFKFVAVKSHKNYWSLTMQSKKKNR